MLDGGAVDILVARIFHDIKQEKKILKSLRV